jgi:site-specific DNA-methyltransferase (adenine-specific)
MARGTGRTNEVSAEPKGPARVRRPTSTSAFGVSRRENHDSTEFYNRFPTPRLSEDDHVVRADEVDRIWVGDARDPGVVDNIPDSSVALVVTSPPYFAGKEYETAIGEGHVPESYATYLQMLFDVFEQCERKLEPGGRIAVNVANLGRKPFRSLASDVTDILQRLGLLLRGEVIWVKGKAAGGSCAWGTFQRPGNPVLRDLSERIVIASKGRFDRARTARQRHEEGLPSTGTITADEFMDLTTDVWELAPESATRVGHPAPFPIELPRKLIDLYTYHDDLVLDPFMGSGTTAVAALRTGRRFVGFDTDRAYVDLAEERVRVERERLENEVVTRPPVRVPAVATPDDGEVDPQTRAVKDGRKAKDLARIVIADAGFVDIGEDVKAGAGVEVSFRARDRLGEVWYFDVSGGFSSSRPGLKRNDTLWKALGKASVLAAGEGEARLVLLTTDRPAKGSPGAKALSAVVGTGPGRTVREVVELLEEDDLKKLQELAEGLVR